MPLSFMRDSVTVKRPTTATKNGQEYFDWTNPTTKTINNVQVTEQATARDFGDRTLQISDRKTLRARYDADIQAGDHIVYDGDEYEIDGDVVHTKSPTGRVSSTRCTLTRWEG